MADIKDKTTRVGSDNFDRVTGDQGLSKNAQAGEQGTTMNADVNANTGTMNAPGTESKDFGLEQKPDINKTPLV